MYIYEAEIKQYLPAAYATAYIPELLIFQTQPFPQLFDRSGTVVAVLPAIMPGDRFEPVSFKVRGLPFSGKLRNLSGVAVREVSEIVGSDGAWGDTPGTQRGFILDFGGMRSILRLLVTGSTMKYVLVLPWQGTDFAIASLYPSQTGTTPSRVPDAGAAQISLRGAESQKLYVQVAGNLTLDQFLDACVVETLVFPANLRASVGDRPPFWTHPGPLQGETVMTGIGEALTSLAADLTAPLTPRLTVQSDAPGVIELPPDFGFLTAEKSASVSWAGSPSTRIDLRAGVPGAFPLHLPAPIDGKPWELRSLKMEVAATLAPWIFEAITPDPSASPAAIRIDARLSAAQRINAEQAVELHGAGLFLAASSGLDAELSVELQTDDRGRPDGNALAARMLPVSGEAAWHEVLFETPLALEPGSTHWIVVKAKSGTAMWSAAAAPDAITALFSEEGTAWQPYPRMLPSAPAPTGAPPTGIPAIAAPAAGLRLFRAPRPEENQPRVVVSHANGADVVEMSLPVADEAMEVEWLWPAASRPLLPPSDAGRQITLNVRSLASGGLDIASATVFFAWKEA